MSLDGTSSTSSLDQLQMVEFGRGFGYKVPLSIRMPSVGSTILKQIVSVWCFRLTLAPTLTPKPDPDPNLDPDPDPDPNPNPNLSPDPDPNLDPEADC